MTTANSARDPKPDTEACQTLTDRYVAVATRGLPEEQRRDVEAELRATVADMVEAKLAAAADAADPASIEDTERAALRELGDPERLADAYRDSGPYLIGPTVYRSWRQVLRTLLPVVPPLSGGATMLARLLAGDDPISALLFGLWVAFVVACNVALWVTVVFAWVERSDSPDVAAMKQDAGADWDVDRLPSVPTGGRVPTGEAVGSIVAALLTIAFLLWQRDGGPFAGLDAGPLLDPQVWDLWLPVVVVVLAAGVVLEMVRLRVGTQRWVAVAAIALNVVVAVPFVLVLLGQPLLNVEVMDALWPGRDAADGTLDAALAAGVLLVLGWDCVEEVRAVDASHRSA
jgi:hypothetical protein